MSAPPGELALVLHTHLPYVRGHGVWPVGEEWLFQAWGTSWLPVTRLLEGLAEEGRRDILTISVTPMVAHQVRDERLGRDLATWLAGQTWRSEEQRWHASMGPAVQALSTHWWRHFRGLADYHDDVQRRGGLTAVWAALADAGAIEVLGGPATHPYLPLVRDPAIIDAQLAIGLDDHAGWLGRRPTGLWPPELGHRPRGRVADACADPESVDHQGTPTLPRVGGELPGLEEHYATHGISHIVVDAPTLVRAAGGAERDWTVRPEAPLPGTGSPDEVVHDGVLIGDSDVVAYARDLAVAYHVWSPTAGYPGNAWYRDYHATGGFGVHPSWRVTDRALPPDAKSPYEPDAARAQVERDAEHFHGVVRGVLDDRPGALVVAAYDTELLGHWWFEGVAWLGRVLDRVAEDPRITTTTLASRRARREPTRRLDLPESSWGYAKGHASWVSPDTRPLWVTVVASEARARAALATGRASPDLARAIARELALVSSSDWLYMTTRGNAQGYGAERIARHSDRLERLCAAAEGDGATQVDALAELGDQDDAPRDVAPLIAALSGDSSTGDDAVAT